MIAIDYQIAYMEVLEILKHISVNDYKKIPEKRLRLFEKYAKKDIDFQYDSSKTLDEQDVSEKAKILIAILYRDYWATDEQRKKILAIEQAYQEKIEEEKREKYNPDSIFKQTNNKEMEIKQDTITNNTSMIEYKESIFKKILSKFKSIFRIK